MVMVTVQDLDIDAGLGHPAGQLSELAGNILSQPLDQNLPFGDDADAGGFQRGARFLQVFKAMIEDPVTMLA